jgi:hypothetical protein
MVSRLRYQNEFCRNYGSPGFSESLLAKTSLSRAAHLGDWRSEFDVEDRVRHCDGLIGRGAIPFFERDFVCYRVTE